MKFFSIQSIYQNKKFYPTRDLNRGFTLIELVVVLSIFVIISSVILADYPGFSQRVALERTAQEIALSLREAETLALSVRESSLVQGEFVGFGVHFNIATPREYILFSDLNGNNSFQANEEVDHFFIEKSPIISRLCVGTETNLPDDCNISVIDMVYLRPDPTITITADGVWHPQFSLRVATPDASFKEIVAWFTGQIEIR